jgi:hypothetical protein
MMTYSECSILACLLYMLDTTFKLGLPKFLTSCPLSILLSPTDGPWVVFAMPERTTESSRHIYTIIVDCYIKVLKVNYLALE